MTADLIVIIDAYLYKAIRRGYYGNLKMLAELYDADLKLCTSMLHITHVPSYSTIVIFTNEAPHFSLHFCSPLLSVRNKGGSGWVRPPQKYEGPMQSCNM